MSSNTVSTNIVGPAMLKLCTYLIPTVLALFTGAQSSPIGPKSSSSTPPDPSVAAKFDVASIRVASSTSVPSQIANPPRQSSFNAVNVSLRDLMEVAYATPETQIFGGPDWAQSGRFDVHAKSGSELDETLRSMPLQQARHSKQQMLVRLLADRFGLAVHPQFTTMPAYLLIPDKNGPKLQRSDSGTANLESGQGRISIRGANDALDILAFELSWRLGRPVLNRSGLAGPYRIELTWASDDSAPGANVPNGPSIFTAVQEQLGLKLEPAKTPVPTLVIDHAVRPSPN